MHALALTVSIHRDALDYVAAISGLVGGLAAAVALILTVQSKRDAARSAVAAEATQRLADEQVAIMRREANAAEAQRGLRAAPEIELGARAMMTSHDEPPDWIILSVGLSNENGNRSLDHLAVNLNVPDIMGLEPCDQDGAGGGHGGVAASPDHQLGEHRGSRYWYEADIGPIDRRLHIARYVKLLQPPVGTHEIQAELMNEDLPDGHSFHAWLLDVPASGAHVQLRRIPTTRR